MADVRSWGTASAFRYPSAIFIPDCPLCGNTVTVSMRQPSPDGTRNLVAATGSCPHCQAKLHCLCFYTNSIEGPNEPSAIYIYPPPHGLRQPPRSLSMAPEPVRLCFEQALVTYNKKVWPASLMLCGRTLEAMIKHLPHGETETPGRHQGLGQLNERLAKYIAATSPMDQLADSIRLGRNMGAHYNETHEPNEIVARKLLDLCEYLIEYLYTLPQMVQETRAALESSD